MKHPAISDLAIHAGGDLPWWKAWRMDRHVDGCEQCRREIALFRDASVAFREQTSDLPEDIAWDRMAGEMRANIRLGLEASEAIRAYDAPAPETSNPVFTWPMAAAAAGILVLLSIGYWAAAVRKSEQLAAARGPEPVVLEASERGVGISDGSKGMELYAPKTARQAAIVTVSTGGAATAQYLDEDTGQITVNHVFVD